MENYNFEEFNAVGGRINPTINLNPSGFSISAGFTKKYDLKEEKAVKLFFDSSKNAVGFKFLLDKEPGSLKLKLNPNQGGGYISSKAFLVKYDIEAKKYQGRYNPKEVESTSQGKFFVIDLIESNR